jgi:hypothetical protein
VIIELDPRDFDGHRSLERHRPDLPMTDKQVDSLWSYAEQPGGWAALPAPIPEPSTWLLFSIGFACIGFSIFRQRLTTVSRGYGRP